MFQLRLRGIPVQVHFSHVLFSLLLGFSFAQGENDPAAWPGTVVANLSHPNRGQTLALVTVLWAFVITGSVLVHELGHALSSKAFGYAPTVHLMGMGGQTRPNGPAELPWHREVLLTLAGPAAGLLLGLFSGGVLLVLERLGPVNVALAYTLRGAFIANVFWALVNLVPVTPLDGGHVARAVLMRLFGRPGFLYAQLITLAFSAAGVALGVIFKSPLFGLLFGLWGFRAVTVIQAYQRGEVPEGLAAHPLHLELAAAEASLRAGKLSDAARTGDRILRSVDVPAAVKSRAHHLLGWVALKSSNGAEALRHFRAVEHQPVPPHALAAALSLTGDEAAALPLWAEAARASNDPTLRHEFAGALLRAGREADARKLPDVRLSAAYLAAERVLYLRGEYPRAAAMAEAAFQEEPSAALAFTAACNWARAKDVSSALRCLALASQNGFADRQQAQNDPDLTALRGQPEFDAWVASLPGATATSS